MDQLVGYILRQILRTLDKKTLELSKVNELLEKDVFLFKTHDRTEHRNPEQT